MPNLFVFADEAGDFTFKETKGASKYFMICTLSADSCKMSSDLLAIRRDINMSGEADYEKLHATSDKQATRDAVFDILEAHDFRIDVTILEKKKAQPQTRTDDQTFYQYAWYYHLKYLCPPLLKEAEKLMITAASLGSKKTRASFKLVVNNTMQQLVERNRWEVAFLDSAKDPMLWAADYCAWAIQRKWEMGDERSWERIRPKLRTEFDLWKAGSKTYY
jgi:hypothetical protein